MKKIYFIFSALLMAMLTACSSDVGPKEITPTSTDFIEGDLARYIEVVDQPYELTFVKDAEYSLRLKVTLRMIKDGFKNVDARDIKFINNDNIISLVDENGDDVQPLLVLKDDDELKLKKLLTGSKGDTAEIVFEWDGSQNDFQQAKQFTQYCLSDIEENDVFELSNVLLPSQLKGKVEVISAKKSVCKYGFPSMEITFKLLSTVNTSSMCSAHGQMWIVGVGQTENGVDVNELLPSYREWRSGDSDGEEFKEFLESDPDATITLEFSGSKESSNDVKSDLKKVKKFKLKITN